MFSDRPLALIPDNHPPSLRSKHLDSNRMKDARTVSTAKKKTQTPTRSQGGSSPGPSQPRPRAKATAVITIDSSSDENDGGPVASGIVVRDEDDSDEYFNGGNEVDQLDSDHLDDDSEEEVRTPKKGKRKPAGGGGSGKKGTPAKKKQKAAKHDPKGKNLREAEQLELAEAPEGDRKSPWAGALERRAGADTERAGCSREQDYSAVHSGLPN